MIERIKNLRFWYTNCYPFVQYFQLLFAWRLLVGWSILCEKYSWNTPDNYTISISLSLKEISEPFLHSLVHVGHIEKLRAFRRNPTENMQLCIDKKFQNLAVQLANFPCSQERLLFIFALLGLDIHALPIIKFRSKPRYWRPRCREYFP